MIYIIFEKATIAIQPVYKVGIFEVSDLDTWVNKTVTSFQKVRGDYSNANRANVRIQVLLSIVY